MALSCRLHRTHVRNERIPSMSHLGPQNISPDSAVDCPGACSNTGHPPAWPREG